jgi:hypothetical protein
VLVLTLFSTLTLALTFLILLLLFLHIDAAGVIIIHAAVISTC